ncbi:MAG: DUF4942 domain-containing protein [Anaerolineae bacterium]|nr:DUF4942 domain-containing protein [Rhodocyclaceae bacterium]MCZ2112823.1 DUF4942 domain-containing protein [Anaerolineae bacterium]GIK44729.1 MAG: hypothetical protein BroJett012_06320 [Betaproteobacteria bacterium]
MDYQFYPTPPDLVRRMWKKFKNDFVRILEPSAGNGDLLRNHPFEFEWGRRGAPDIDCCEIDVSRHATLRANKFNVVGLDFLQYGSGAHYSHIIMNPPFAEGAKHILKAWEILWDGEIAAIVNAETIRNPYSRERQFLAKLIEAHGEVEFIEGAFAVGEAERKTDVDIAIVYLRKRANADSIVGDLLAELRRGTDSEKMADQYKEINALALPNSAVENLVIAFNAAVQSMRDSVFSEARAGYYASLLGATMAESSGDMEKKDAKVSAEWVQKQIGERYLNLKDRAWTNILRSSNITSRLSSAVQRRLESEFEQIKQLEFTVSNIYGFICGLIDQQGRLQIDMICDVFDEICKFHSENAVWFKGWKSNDRHRAGLRIKTTRFILPGHQTESYCTNLRWESQRLMADFDKVFAMLDGQAEPAMGLEATFRAHFGDLRRGARVSSSYFDIRYYPAAGTIHFFPRDKKLIDRLNRVVGRHRAWLPPEGAKVSDAFWLQYEQAEKFDREVQAEINRAYKGSYWDHPLQKVHRPIEESAHALEAIDEAVTRVLEKHGISVEYQIEERPQSSGQLPLLEAA